jgi:aryl-alcohol dehydrogenase-like predicted oxidoreductase
VDSLQQEFSMVSLADRKLVRWCGERGTGVVSYGPLGFGLLTGAVGQDTAFADADWRSGSYEDAGLFEPTARRAALRVVDGMRPVAERLGITLAQLALAWNVHQPGVTSAIAGSRSSAHVRENSAAGDVVLDAEILSELEGLLG